MNNPTILLVGDEVGVIRFLSESVHAARGSLLEIVPRLEDAHARAANADLALVIVHLREGEDIRKVARLREYFTACDSTAALLIVCDEYRAAQARDALLFGALDYLPRPLDLNQVTFLVEMQVLRILRQRGLSRVKSPAQSDRELRPPGTSEVFLCTFNSPAEHVGNMVRRVAPLLSTVLLGGETGTGKSRLRHRSTSCHFNTINRSWW